MAVNGELRGAGGGEVLDVTHDSRQARAGSLFAAVKGAQFDAHRFVAQVMEQGAVGVLSELEAPAGFEGAWMEVKGIRRAMALAAAEVHGHPSREIPLVGITGTNGKTTTTYLVAAIAEAAGQPVAMTTTVEYKIDRERWKAERTTPEATDMQRILRRAVEAGCRLAVMESSSQAIDLHRCDALQYSVAVFTNLTRDHLDYHGTMDNYFAAKRRLFDASLGGAPKTSIINVDDERGAQLADELEGSGTVVVRYALNGQADVTATEVE